MITSELSWLNGDYVIGDSVISRVYYVEGLGHNLFSIGQFYDSDLEVTFRKRSCFVRDINGADLLKGSRSTNLYTISIDDMMKSSPIKLVVPKPPSPQSWRGIVVNAQVVPPGIVEEPTLEDSPITHDALHPSFNPVAGEPGLAQSSSRNVNSAEPNQVT
ncbi:hypothetical protein Tco_1190845 [Tanacetum coccineum]